jgi:hypothetical protein
LQGVHKLAPVIDTWLRQLLQHHIKMLRQCWYTALSLLVVFQWISTQLPKNGICSWQCVWRTVECRDAKGWFTQGQYRGTASEQVTWWVSCLKNRTAFCSANCLASKFRKVDGHTGQLTHCGPVFFPLYLSQIINSK